MARTNNLKAYFKPEISPYSPKYYTIRFNDDLFSFGKTSSSRNILMARLLNLSWADFLRTCRDVYGAELRGKNTIYIVPYFTIDNSNVKSLCNELNKRFATLLDNEII